MSIEIVLLPLAIAAVSAWQAKREADEAGRQVVAVGTRMKNERLLEAALADTGAAVSRVDTEIVAEWSGTDRDRTVGDRTVGDRAGREGTRARFARSPDGIWVIRLHGEVTPDEATDLARRIDAAYGRRVQQEVLIRLRERAPEVGMTVESETVEDDDSVLLTLTVGST